MSDGETIVVVAPAGGETPPAEAAPVEVAAEATADAAVEIARIEGETAVALAEIHAEANQAEVETIAAAIESEQAQELSVCRERINSLEAENSTLRAQVEELLTPPSSSLEEPPPQSLNPDAAAVDPTPESPAEVAAEHPVPEPPKKKRGLLWI